MTTLCCCKRGIWSGAVLCSSFHIWDSCFLKSDKKILRMLRTALLLSPGAWLLMWSHIWQNRYHVGTEWFASFYQDLSKCFIMEIKPDPLFHRWEKPGPGSVSNKQMARIQILVWLSVHACMYEHASLSGAWQRATGYGASTCRSQVLPVSTSQNPKGSGAVAESQPHMDTGCMAPGPGPTALVWAPLLRAQLCRIDVI